jgi:hypothetical protein
MAPPSITTSTPCAYPAETLPIPTSRNPRCSVHSKASMLPPSQPSHNDVPELPESAQLNTVRTTAAQWIAAADLKATAILAVAGAIAAIAAPAFTAAGGKEAKFAQFALAAFAIFDVVTIAASAIALWPRTDRAKILKKKAWNAPLERSATFFGDLAELSAEDFRNWLIEAKRYERRDAYEQALVISVIANEKMLAMRSAIVLLGVTLALIVTALILAAAGI